jgi:hypothetical protein
MNRNLQSVATFATAGPFSAGQLRWFIFCSEQNGLAATGAIVRIGRRVYIDVDKFEAWIDSQNQPARAAA